MSTTDAELIRAARRRITRRERWCRGTRAMTADGVPVQPLSPDAAQWCALGALQCEAAHRGLSLKSTIPIREAICAITGVSLIDSNDRGGHAAVLQLMDFAADELERREADK